MPVVRKRHDCNAFHISSDCEQLIHQRVHNGEKQSFYSSVSLTRSNDDGSFTQIVSIGSLCAVKCQKTDYGYWEKKTRLYQDEWRVGRVIAIEQDAKHLWHATMQWVPHFLSSCVQSTLNKQEIERLKGVYRYPVLLYPLATAPYERTKMESILPIQLQLRDSAYFSRNPKKLKPEEHVGGYFSCCLIWPHGGTILQHSDTDDKLSLWQIWKREFPCPQLQDSLQASYLAQAEKMECRFSVSMENNATSPKRQRTSVEQKKVSGKDSIKPITSARKRRKPAELTVTSTTTESTKDEESVLDSLDQSFSYDIAPTCPKASLTLSRFTDRTWKKSDELHFYDGVELNLDPVLYPTSVVREQRRWKIQVGDLIALACEKSSPPTFPPVKNKSVWYPFGGPWSPVQVVAIFHGADYVWKMQFRWLHRPKELRKDLIDTLPTDVFNELFRDKAFSAHAAIEVDEMVEEAPIQAALGRLVITSTAKPTRSFRQTFVNEQGIPQFPLICRYLYRSEFDELQLHDMRDWDDYGTKLAGPLSRGLACPKTWPGKHNKVLKAIVRDVSKRLQLKDKLDASMPSARDTEKRLITKWPQHLLELDLNATNLDLLHSSEECQFWNRVQLPMVPQRCFVRRVALSVPQLQVSVGDVVCIACNDVTRDSSHVSWNPFIGPWRVAQVLSIYNFSKSQTQLEVRWFYRRCDFSPVTPPPPLTHFTEEEVFETEMVESGIPANRILGLVDLFLAHFPGEVANDSEIPRAACRCSFQYKSLRFQPIFSSETSPAKWRRHLLERGLKASKLIPQYEGLDNGVEFLLGVSLSIGDLFDQAMTEEETCRNATDTIEGMPGHLLSVSLQPPWTYYATSEWVCALADRRGKRWTVRIGDVVAVRANEMIGSQKDDHYPYTVPWRPCQVLAIHESNSVTFKVRLFSVETGNVVLETDDISEICLGEMLGPVALTDYDSTIFWDAVCCFLPFLSLRYGGHRSQRHRHLSSLLSCALQSSGLYDKRTQTLILKSLSFQDCNARCLRTSVVDRSEDISETPEGFHEDEQSSIVQTDSWTTCPPFYSESALGFKYFPDVSVRPPYRNYVPSSPTPDYDQTWTIRLGDVVLVQCKGARGRGRFGRFVEGAIMTYPMYCEWAVCEIVTIYLDANQKGNPLKLEIRWFLRAQDLPAGTIQHDTDEFLSEEIFESDFYETIDPSCVLAPAVLHDKKVSILDAKYSHGMPVMEFCCNRFWSCYHRRWIITAGSSSRLERGRLHSSHFSENNELREALSLPIEKSMLVAKPDQCADAFKQVIAKLSLTDASKEALDNGVVLVGRERERKQLLSFLRNAIAGIGESGKLSMFVAGAPGTGKTACVRAAIHELRGEQSKGRLAPFVFVVLNGMEMRHPFEAYVKLWDALCGSSTGNPERAAALLEAYFTKDDHDGAKGMKKNVVVLLDEIDYLLTKKQSVLYNFFDWPRRSLESGSGRKLIVVGVSNTLNLPERLHPRVQSRIGTQRCFFKSYSADEIAAILKLKVRQASPTYAVFDDDAILFASKKTSALSGDIRKAFHVCREAAQTTLDTFLRGLSSSKPCVRIQDVLRVSRESGNSAQARAASRCTSLEVLLLITLASLNISTGRESTGFDMEEILTKMQAIANSFGDEQYLPAPDLQETLDILTRLCEAHLVSLQTPRNVSVSFRSSLTGSGGPWPLTKLLVEDTVVKQALRKTSHAKLAEKHLSIQNMI